jgi:hypothetical protein
VSVDGLFDIRHATVAVYFSSVARLNILCKWWPAGRYIHPGYPCRDNIIDDEFPAGHPIHKIFNRNTVKISYSCMPNIKQTIDGHNKTKLSETAATSGESTCNCKKKEELCVLCK